GGPLPITFDRFRVAWEEMRSRNSESPEAQKEAERKLLLAKAFEMLGDEERRAAHLPLALEAYRESLNYRKDGYVEHRLGTVLSELGHLDSARETLKSAVSHEPFFFGARRALAGLELNRG